MSEIFLKIVNMSISASWIVLAVLVLRLLIKKAPKWLTVLLWGIVAIRLVCPFTIESAMSLIPSAETLSPEIMTDQAPQINSGIPIINGVINPIINGSLVPAPGASANPMQILIPIFAAIWAVGTVALLIYALISFINVHRKVSTAVLLRDNIYQCETVASPFVLGTVKPKIYLPFKLDDQNAEHVISHELSHIERKDHLWKPLGFLLLALHWFNPLMWLAYVLLCRDIELACDEKVIKKLGSEQRADYSEALLACSVSRRMIAACPLAFGEVGVKERVKSVLNYKKPAFWIIIVAIVACIAVAVCFLTDPKNNDDDPDLDPDINNIGDPSPAPTGGDPYEFFEKLAESYKDSTLLKKETATVPEYEYMGGVQTAITVSESISGHTITYVDAIIFEYTNADEARSASKKIKDENKNATTHPQSVLEEQPYEYGKQVDERHWFMYDKYIILNKRYSPTTLKELTAAYGAQIAGDRIRTRTSYSENSDDFEIEDNVWFFSITFCDDGTYTYSPGTVSSYIGFGVWKKDGDIITLTEKYYNISVRLRVEDGCVVYLSEGSTQFFSQTFEDGEKLPLTDTTSQLIPIPTE